MKGGVEMALLILFLENLQGNWNFLNFFWYTININPFFIVGYRYTHYYTVCIPIHSQDDDSNILGVKERTNHIEKGSIHKIKYFTTM